MQAVHQNMCIPQIVFDYFVTSVVGVLDDNSVSGPDQAAVRGVLNSMAGMIVNGAGQAPCNTAAPSPPPQGAQCGTLNYQMATKLKTNAHPQFGMGFLTGWTVNGVEGAAITLYVGCTYKFNSSAICIHPFYFTDNAIGASTGADFLDGIASSDYTQVCSGNNIITWTITQSVFDAAALTPIFYECRVHTNMGGVVNIMMAPTPATPANVPSTPPAGPVTPVTAVGPVTPVTAVGPVTPVTAVGPVTPVTPAVTAVGPVSPVTNIGASVVPVSVVPPGGANARSVAGLSMVAVLVAVF
jgi:hypothetical protein